MAIKFQYNKTSLQTLDKQLKVRKKTLPTLKNKESALRLEVKRAKDDAIKLDEELQEALKKFDVMSRLWEEFEPSLIRIKDVELSSKKIAGIVTPILDEIIFEIAPYNIFNHPVWFADGIAVLKYLAETAIKREVYLRKMELLDYARKKTTQKVNLYEKVQIPGFDDAIRKIKRFLEDEENLSKSAQKIVKTRQIQEVES
jgi:V/A-type H+-transporting ATPase subunit D